MIWTYLVIAIDCPAGFDSILNKGLNILPEQGENFWAVVVIADNLKFYQFCLPGFKNAIGCDSGTWMTHQRCPLGASQPVMS